MNLKTKKIISSLLIAANLAMPANITLAKQESSHHKEVKVYFNDEQIEFDQQPIIVDGRTKVPFRAIFETMGTVVYYRESDKSIIGLSRDGDVIKHIVGTNKATINGVEKTYDSISEIRNYRTLIPVRMVADLLNAEVEWDGKNQEVEIEKDIVTNEYHKQIKKILECTLDQNFNPEDFKRYLEYQSKHWNMDPKQVVLDVNMDLDRELVEREIVVNTGKYTFRNTVLTAKEEDITIVEDIDSNTVLVNHFNHLPYDYVPNNLVYSPDVSEGDKKLYKELEMGDYKKIKNNIYDDYSQMRNDYSNKHNNGYCLETSVAFQTQERNLLDIINVLSPNVDSLGINQQDKLKFVSGHCYFDLQTGLSIHLGESTEQSNAYRFKKQQGYTLTEKEQGWIASDDNTLNLYAPWLKENAHLYGFVQRYPSGKEHITRMLPNDSYYRYVGKDVAKIMHDENLCLEEYCAKYESKTSYTTDKEAVKKKILERY